MQKNLYYRTVFRRDNVIKKAILDFFLAIASYPRLLLEVFIRKNFGERYFSLASVLTITVILLVFPGLINSLMSLGHRGFDDDYGSFGRNQGFFSESALWYVFIAAFLVFSILRWLEVRKNPSVFDFKRFSLYTGDINPLFNKIKVFDKPVNTRWIEIFFEPLPFFILGFILYLLKQKLGIVLCFSAVCYGLSYAGAYRNGDNFVMDKIDEMIVNQEQHSAFVDEEDAGKTSGVRFYARRPNAKELREKVLSSFSEGEDDTIVS